MTIASTCRRPPWQAPRVLPTPGRVPLPGATLSDRLHAGWRAQGKGWLRTRGASRSHLHVGYAPASAQGRAGGNELCTPPLPLCSALGGRVTPSRLRLSPAPRLQAPFCRLDQPSPTHSSPSPRAAIINKCDYEVQMCWCCTLSLWQAFSFLTWCYELIIKALYF